MGPAYAFNSIQGQLREQLILDNEDEWTTESFEFYPKDSSERCEIFRLESGSGSSDEGARCEAVENPDIREDGFTNTGGTYMGYLNQYVVPYVQDNIVFNTTVTAVKKIESDGFLFRSGAVCTNGDTFYRAENVVVALPLPLLQDRDVVFEPDYLLKPNLQETIDSIKLVDGVRFWLEFSEPFFPQQLELERENSFPINCIDAFLGQPSERYILTNVGIGQTGLAELSDDDIIKRVLDDLDAIYDGKARETLVGSYVQNWSKKPLTKYIFSDDEEPRDYEIYKEPIFVGGNIFLAGEYAIEARNYALNARRVAEKIVGRRFPNSSVSSSSSGSGSNDEPDTPPKRCRKKERPKALVQYYVKRKKNGVTVKRKLRRTCEFLAGRKSRKILRSYCFKRNLLLSSNNNRVIVADACIETCGKVGVGRCRFLKDQQ